MLDGTSATASSSSQSVSAKSSSSKSSPALSASETSSSSLHVSLKRELDARECERRNALSRTRPGFALGVGTVGTVLETFEGGEAFLVEFTQAQGGRSDACDWMGVLYPSEVEIRSASL